MSRGFGGTFEQINVSFSAVSMPFSMGAWVYPEDDTVEMCVIGYTDFADDDEYFILTLRGDIGGDTVRAEQGSGVTSDYAETSSGFTANTWHHVCAVFVSTTERHVYIDGGSEGTDTNSQSAPSVNNLGIGFHNGISDTKWLDGNVAHAFLIDRALSDEEVASIAAGNMVIPALEGSVWRLNERAAGTAYDYNSVVNITSGSSTTYVADAPPVYYPVPGRAFAPTVGPVTISAGVEIITVAGQVATIIAPAGRRSRFSAGLIGAI